MVGAEEATGRMAGHPHASPNGRMVAARDAIAAYYTATAGQYARWWHPTLLHYGYGPEPGSVARMTAEVGARLAPRPGGHYAEGGCGVGGNLIAWAQATPDTTWVGCTVTPAQAAAAADLIAAAGLAARVQVRVGDYQAWSDPPATYDGCVFLESLCYAPDPAVVLAEAARIVRPGGRLVIADGFRWREPATAAEAARFAAWCAAWRLPGLATRDALTAALQATGWHLQAWEDWSRAVQPSVRRLRRLAWLAAPVVALGRLAPAERDNWRAAWLQATLFGPPGRALCGYGCWVATR